MQPRDEWPHEYPKDLQAPWKENWYFNFIDRDRRAWGINHVSLMRDTQKGRFAAFHIIDDEILMYANVIDIDDEMKEITDGALKFDFIEPFKRFKVTLDGPRHKVELNYEARFEAFDYNMGKESKGGYAMSINHYEQALSVTGVIEKDGQKRTINCLGHRDHSWGYRNEAAISSWNWAAIQMDDKTVNMSRVAVGEAFFGAGFVSTREGNVRIVRTNIEKTDFEGDIPVSSVFEAEDETGKKWRFKSQKFSGLYLPMQEKGEGVVVHENFAEYTDLDTGQQGIGIDEYLINPNG